MDKLDIRLHLDVDGVINVISAPALAENDWQSPVKVGPAASERATFDIYWVPKMVEQLAALNLDLWWTTTWQDDAVKTIAPLIGYGEDGSVVYPKRFWGYSYSIDWKFEAMQELYPEGNPMPFVWIDDELTEEHVEWAESRGGLALLTDHLHGITPAHITAIEEYIAQV